MTKSHTEFDIAAHEAAMIQAFAEVLKAEEALSHAKKELADATTLLGMKVNRADTALERAWEVVRVLMAETGEPEVLLPGTVTDYKIAWSTPRETVKAEDANAVPDAFCKIERKPKLKEIGDFLKGLRESNQQFPNWARFETGERKLQWKALKKNAA